MIFEFIFLSSFALFIFYKWSISTFDYFEKRNIPFDKPFPLLGNSKDFLLHRISIYEQVLRLYNLFNTRYFGTFDQRQPLYVIRDPTLIKLISVKDFDNFNNRRSLITDRDGGLFSNSLFVMRNEKWKDMRYTLSPIFTGSKMRLMFTLTNEVAQVSIKYLTKETNENEEIELNIKDYFTRFSNDVIASSVFGFKINSFQDENNEFYRMGKRLSKFTFLQNIRFFLYMNFKFIARFFRMQLFPLKDTNYFTHLVLDTMKYRQENKIFRPDMINMMMEARGTSINKEDINKKIAFTSREWTDSEIVSQFTVFFFAGFETSAVLMSFAAHELMENPDCQKRLYEEVMEVKKSLNGKPLSYEALQNMKYMDMVISETLRKWPPQVAVDRECNKDFNYKEDDFEFNMKAGEIAVFPIVGIHLDEKYFPDPLKFEPERFSDENKGNIQPFTYIPFGVGPRSCIANRFALLEAKAILFHLLSEFELRASEKTTRPMKLEAGSFNLGPKNGFWLKLLRI